MAKSAKAKETGELLDQRTTIMLSNSDLVEIDDWRAERRIWSRGEAIRQLMAIGLKASTQKD